MHTLAETSQAERVLVVDDEPLIRDTVALNLRREGLDVIQAATGPEAIELAREQRPDLIVLDVMLPGLDGFEVCRRIREDSTVPILLLSARGEEVDRIVGLEIGADDYLTKPFAMRELVARVRAMLRRARMVPLAQVMAGTGEDRALASVEPPVPEGRVIAGDLVVDVPRREASVAGRALSLKPREFDLLLYFARHPGIVLTRDALLREVWGYDFPVDTRTVDVHIRWLRQKIEHDPALPTRLVTVRGLGYRLVALDATS